jgi:hypothetical protein
MTILRVPHYLVSLDFHNIESKESKIEYQIDFILATELKTWAKEHDAYIFYYEEEVQQSSFDILDKCIHIELKTDVDAVEFKLRFGGEY